MSTPRLIVLGGFANCGKSSVAARLQEQHGFTVLSFAGLLKNIVSEAFGWDREQLEGSTPESRVWRETVDPWWARELGMPELTPRHVLRVWGTDLVRDHFHSNFWITALQRKLEQEMSAGRSVVISDARFENEFAWARRLGAAVWHIERKDFFPPWFAAWVKSGRRDVLVVPSNVHSSESQWLCIKPDLLLLNDCTFEALGARVDSALASIA